MEALSQCLSSVGGLVSSCRRSSNNNKKKIYVKRTRKNAVIYCQSASGGESSIRATAIATAVVDHSKAEEGGTGSTLSSSPNGSLNQTQKTAAIEELPSLLDVQDRDDGIGIIEFLRGKHFFITGATGFLAKVLIEKILRTVPDVGNIYLLIKAKDKEEAAARLKKEIIEAELFEHLQRAHGRSYQEFMLSKLIPVVGNVCESNLGLSSDVAQVISEQVDVIVNSAASTTFDGRYDLSIDINTKGPCRLMTFAKKCNKLKLFLQVSTAYVNGKRQGRIMEKPFSIGDSIVGEILNSEQGGGLLNNSSSSSSNSGLLSLPVPVLDVEAELKLAADSKGAWEEMEDNLALAQRMKELGLNRAKRYGWQDTYVFTKAMGEMLINKMRGDIPVVIMRPSVIESTFKEPFPGWMEGNRMMDPIILFYGKGQLTGFLVNPEGVLDVVPADMVVNATLAAMAKHGTSRGPGISVYQIASSVVNPLIFQDLAKLLYEHYTTSPCTDAKGKPIQVPSMKLFETMEDFCEHIRSDAIKRTAAAAASQRSSPLCVDDGDDNNDNNINKNKGGSRLSRKMESMCRRSVEQAKYLANIYEPYTFYAGRFDNSNTQRLMEKMSEEEKGEFGFDVGSIDWKEYITNVHIPGLRRHVLNTKKPPPPQGTTTSTRSATASPSVSSTLTSPLIPN